MRTDRDPPRLRTAANCPPGLAEALNLARADLPRAQHIEDVEKGLGPLLSHRRSAPAPLRPMAASAAMGFKWLLAAAVAAASLGGGLHYLRASHTAERASSVVPPSSNKVPPAKPSRSVTPDLAASSPAKEEPVAPPAPKPVERSGHDRERALTEPSSPAPSRAPSGPVASSGSLPDATATEELTLLERATHALGSNPQAALEATEEHARRFPAGALSQEREFVAIEALEALGRTAEANARIDRFRARFPGSAHLRRLEQLGTSGTR